MTSVIVTTPEEMRRIIREELASLATAADVVMSKHEAAAHLKISEATLMRKVTRRELKKLPGSPPRFLKSELERRR